MRTLAVDEYGLLPGGDLVAKGLTDLQSRLLSEEALLVLIASPRLTKLGLEVPDSVLPNGLCEHALYELIEKKHPRGAHAAYNALIRRVSSFADAYALASRRLSRADPP